MTFGEEATTAFGPSLGVALGVHSSRAWIGPCSGKLRPARNQQEAEPCYQQPSEESILEADIPAPGKPANGCSPG